MPVISATSIAGSNSFLEAFQLIKCSFCDDIPLHVCIEKQTLSNGNVILTYRNALDEIVATIVIEFNGPNNYSICLTLGPVDNALLTEDDQVLLQENGDPLLIEDLI
jgi:hypothetical protein